MPVTTLSHFVGTALTSKITYNFGIRFQNCKAVAVTGPRQSGKTTLVRKVFPDKPYSNLENPDIRKFAVEDPRGFLAHYREGAILDEVQRAPELFSYLQQILDESPTTGLFILTGSNNFLIQESISQSLAGRVGYLYILPLSLNETDIENSDQMMLMGGYPVLHQGSIETSRFFANYIRTYVERDVRLLKNITDLFLFERFIRLCAGRTGQLLNMNNLSTEVGVNNKTIGSWIGVLETSFIVFRLQPYHRNFNKRIVKTPKLYFYDTGLAVALLGIENVKQLSLSPYRGSLFENLVIVEFLKKRYNKGKSPNLFFWRDNTGNEIDLVMESGNLIHPVEIKSGKTVSEEFFRNLRFWKKLTGMNVGTIIYDGDLHQERSEGIRLIPVRDMHTISI